MHANTVNKVLEGLDRARREIKHVEDMYYPVEVCEALTGLMDRIEEVKTLVRNTRTK